MDEFFMNVHPVEIEFHTGGNHCCCCTKSASKADFPMNLTLFPPRPFCLCVFCPTDEDPLVGAHFLITLSLHSWAIFCLQNLKEPPLIFVQTILLSSSVLIGP